jgi:hypothetical protein
MSNAFGKVAKVGKALMLPVAVLPIAALLLRLGAGDVFDIPFAYDSLLSTGALYYLAKKKRDEDGIKLYAENYYQTLRDFGEAQGMSITQSRSDWNYATQSRNNVTVDE